MALIQQVASGTMPVTNMAFLLALEVGLLHSLDNSTKMRYRNDTALFWEIARSVGGPAIPTVFFESTRELRHEKHQKTKDTAENSFRFTVAAEGVHNCTCHPT